MDMGPGIRSKILAYVQPEAQAVWSMPRVHQVNVDK